MDAHSLTNALGGIWRNGHGQAACPICQPERRKTQNALSISENGHKLLLWCFKEGCSFVEIANAVGISSQSIQIDFEARAESERKRVAYEAERKAKANSLWNSCIPINGTKAEQYLRDRGITCDLPETLRYHPDTYHAPSGMWVCSMIAKVSSGGVHRTFMHKTGKRLNKNAKMMLGPCSGGAVRLYGGDGPLVVCEGIETGLSLMSGLIDGDQSIWASLSTSGMKSLNLPTKADRLTIATDGDNAGRDAGNTLAMRATALGWDVSMLHAPKNKDWNDVLIEGHS